MVRPAQRGVGGVLVAFSCRGRSFCPSCEKKRQIVWAEARQQPGPRRRCPPIWARLIAKVYHADPLVCTRCGQRMSLIAFVTDQMAIGEILEHLGLSTPDAPPSSRDRWRLPTRG